MLEDNLRYTFRDKSLLQKALTHSSYANEKGIGRLNSNERLEFLGDSLLGFFTAEYLYANFKDKPEGEMTRLRAELVCEQSLVRIAQKLDFGRYLRLGKGEEQGGGRNRRSILADAVEAVIAAIYLDGGRVPAFNFVNENVLKTVGDFEISTDYKTTLQEIVQRDGGESPVYRHINEEGPDHNKTFTAEAYVSGKLLGTGNGHSKKEAEQEAARASIEFLNGGNH